MRTTPSASAKPRRSPAIRLALDAGVDVNAANATGDTALHTAATTGGGLPAVIRLLVEKGARLDVKNKADRTPLDAARRARQPNETVDRAAQRAGRSLRSTLDRLMQPEWPGSIVATERLGRHGGEEPSRPSDPDTSNGPRVAVTGATGYIGTRLVPRLIAAGYRVRCLARSPRKLADRPWYTDPRVEIVQSDLSDVKALARQLDGCEAAFYLVHSMLSVGRSYADADRAMASRFTHAASTARVGRIV